MSLTLRQLSSSTSNCSVASAGILGGLPAFPYAYSGAQVSSAFSPCFMVATPVSQPLMTCGQGVVVWWWW
jgi:hypothetical protein